MLVLALHSAYLYAWWAGALTSTQQLWLAIAAYASYCINATQFILKLRAARLQAEAFSRTSQPGVELATGKTA
jgi:3-vinyl bacteriochlorophyllide hydratase